MGASGELCLRPGTPLPFAILQNRLDPPLALLGAESTGTMVKKKKQNLPIFVHFMPPPLRKPDKKDLPWIVHTCDGSGCYEAKHVNFNTLSGFMTYEGQPPEQAEGKACTCQISNHHLRGVGQVRWDGNVAIIEASLDDDDDLGPEEQQQQQQQQQQQDDTATGGGGGGGHKMINAAAYREDARKKSELLASAKDEIKKLKENKVTAAAMADDVKKKLAEAERKRHDLEEGPVKQLSVLKIKHASLDGQYKTLLAKYNSLKAERAQAAEESAGAALLAAAAAAAGGGDASPTKRRRARRTSRASGSAATEDAEEAGEDADEPAPVAAAAPPQQPRALTPGQPVRTPAPVAPLIADSPPMDAVGAAGVMQTASAPPTASGPRRALVAAALKSALQWSAQQVCIVSGAASGGSGGGGGGDAAAGRRGATMSSVVMCSLEPPMVCFNVSKGSQASAVLCTPPPNGSIAIHLLGASGAPLAERFAKRGLSAAQQFDGIDPDTLRWFDGSDAAGAGASAVPPTDVSDGGGGGGASGRLGGGVLAKLACTSACVWEAGDHYVVAAHVTDVEHAEHLPRERVEAAAVATAHATLPHPLIYYNHGYAKLAPPSGGSPTPSPASTAAPAAAAAADGKGSPGSGMAIAAAVSRTDTDADSSALSSSSSDVGRAPSSSPEAQAAIGIEAGSRLTLGGQLPQSLAAVQGAPGREPTASAPAARTGTAASRAAARPAAAGTAAAACCRAAGAPSLACVVDGATARRLVALGTPRIGARVREDDGPAALERAARACAALPGPRRIDGWASASPHRRERVCGQAVGRGARAASAATPAAAAAADPAAAFEPALGGFDWPGQREFGDAPARGPRGAVGQSPFAVASLGQRPSYNRPWTLVPLTGSNIWEFRRRRIKILQPSAAWSESLERSSDLRARCVACRRERRVFAARLVPCCARPVSRADGRARAVQPALPRRLNPIFRYYM